MNRPQILLEKIGPELRTFTLEEVAELAGLVLNESNFNLNNGILMGFTKVLKDKEFFVEWIDRSC